MESEGFRRLHLEVAGYNGRAIAAYRASGFAVSGEYWADPEPGIDVEALLDGPAAEAVSPNVRLEPDGTLSSPDRSNGTPAHPTLKDDLPLWTQPIDLIALDLDGTLLNPDESVSDVNRAAISRALNSGIRVVLVTGRGADTPIRVSRELGLNLPVICCHGALTKDFGANKTLAHIPVPLAYAKPMLEFAERSARTSPCIRRDVLASHRFRTSTCKI